MLDRFYIDTDFALGSQVKLDGPEAHHVARVLRKQPDDSVQLFNGRGTAVDARIETIRGRTVQLVVERIHEIDSKDSRETWIAMSPAKGDRFRWAVEKLTELGVDRLIPLITERSVVHPGDTKLQKLRQTVISACKQCRRNTLMEIALPMKFDALIDLANQQGLDVIVAHPRQTSELASDLRTPSQITAKRSVVCIGPEGGFSEAELQTAHETGAKFTSIGHTILRTETAAVAFAVKCLDSDE